MGIRKNDFKLQLKNGEIKDFEKIVLSSGICELFVPMGFVSSEEGEMVFYDCSGYTALSQYHMKHVREALEVLEKILILISKAGEYLISPSKITLNRETIFYNEKTGQIRIAYVPVSKQWASLKENVIGFVGEVEGEIGGTQRLYLEKVKKHLNHHNYYVKDMINLIGELKRELFTANA